MEQKGKNDWNGFKKKMGGEELEIANIIGNSFEKFSCKGEPQNGDGEPTTTVTGGGSGAKSGLAKKLGEIFVFDENDLEDKENFTKGQEERIAGAVSLRRKEFRI